MGSHTPSLEDSSPALKGGCRCARQLLRDRPHANIQCVIRQCSLGALSGVSVLWDSPRPTSGFKWLASVAKFLCVLDCWTASCLSLVQTALSGVSVLWHSPGQDGSQTIGFCSKFPCVLDCILFVTGTDGSELALFSLTWDGSGPGVEWQRRRIASWIWSTSNIACVVL